MLQFLNAIWFFGAAAIIIPVVIHLWNIKPGKVLKVGSTALITAASRKSSRSFKLLDIPLLLVRCLLLLLFALLLALPVLQQHLKVAKAKGWVMVPKEELSAGYRRYKLSIDSLLGLGYEFHYFNNGLPRADTAALMAEIKTRKNLDTTVNHPANYWGLLKQADSRVPADMPVYLYTTNTIAHFTGDKAQVAMNLHWQTFSALDTVSNWVQDAWFTNNKAIRVIKGTSKPWGTGYQYANIQLAGPNSQFTVNVVNGRATVGLAGAKGKALRVDTATISMAIYTDRNQPDAGYLKAALEAAAQFSQRKIVIKQYGSAVLIPAGQSWLFWLSEQAVPARFLQQPVNIFAYQAGRPANVTSWISTGGHYAVPGGAIQVPLFKMIYAAGTFNDLIWRNGFGQPVLAFNKQGKAGVYHFFSRFNPTWNDLVWNSSFPRLMLQLLDTAPQKDIAAFDRRVISAGQMQPLKINEAHVIADKFIFNKDLSRYFWVALIVVFFAERWLATRNKLI